MPDLLNCFLCQRVMILVRDELFLCRYCGAINYKLKTEHTSFVASWLDTDKKVEDIQNVPVMYWTPPKEEGPMVLSAKEEDK